MMWKLLGRVWLFVTPWTIQSMEFSRTEYWSGYPFPSPRDLPNPGIEPRSPALQVDSLPDEPQGKPKNTAVGSLSLLQRIFLTQELNWGLHHCWKILYELSYQVAQDIKDVWLFYLKVMGRARAVFRKEMMMKVSPGEKQSGQGVGYPGGLNKRKQLQMIGVYR